VAIPLAGIICGILAAGKLEVVPGIFKITG